MHFFWFAAAFCCIIVCAPTPILAAHRSHGAFGHFGIDPMLTHSSERNYENALVSNNGTNYQGPLNGLRLVASPQQSSFLATFCQPGQQKRIPAQVLSPAQLELLCRRIARSDQSLDSLLAVRESRAGGRIFPEFHDDREFLMNNWETAGVGEATMPLTEKRAYDYIRFGRRSLPSAERIGRIAADKKATGGQSTYDYIRFGRRRR